MDLHESSSNNYQTDVSLNITKHLFSNPKFENMNIVFSPISIQLVLSIIAAGSEDSTQHQVLSFLRSKSTDHLNSVASKLVSSVFSDSSHLGGPRLSMASGVWVEKSLAVRPYFEEIVSTHYKAEMASVDFRNKANEMHKEVNLWAENKTNGLVKNLLSPDSVNSLTRLIFANALYFKGAWDQTFDPLVTRDCDFHLLNDIPVKVPFMTNHKRQFISVFDGFKVLGLPYKQGKDRVRQFSMYFYLPDSKDGLSSLIEKMASENNFLENTLPKFNVEVGEFRIPKFKISSGFKTTNVLKELGVVLPFCPGGLTNIVDSLYVSDIIQKSFIEVNEGGTEAAAVTFGIACSACCPVMNPPPAIDFIADHPFLFLIREDFSKTVLFIGQMLNPLDV